MAKTIPSTHTRSVFTGISGSSVLDTADRTSGYGESSSKHDSVSIEGGRDNDEGRTEHYSVFVEIWVVEFGALHVVELRACLH